MKDSDILKYIKDAIAGIPSTLELPPTMLVARNGYTIGVNNVAYANQYLQFGRSSKTSSTYAQATFRLPNNYTSGSDITIHLSWRNAQASDVIDYRIRTYYARDDIVQVAVDDLDATWTGTATAWDYNQETLTMTGTNVLANDIIHLWIMLEDDGNTNDTRVDSISINIPIS